MFQGMSSTLRLGVFFALLAFAAFMPDAARAEGVAEDLYLKCTEGCGKQNSACGHGNCCPCSGNKQAGDSAECAAAKDHLLHSPDSPYRLQGISKSLDEHNEKNVGKMVCWLAISTARSWHFKTQADIAKDAQDAQQKVDDAAKKVQQKVDDDTKRAQQKVDDAAKRVTDAAKFEETMKNLRDGSKAMGGPNKAIRTAKTFNNARGEKSPRGLGIGGEDLKMANDNVEKTFDGWGGILNSPKNVILPQLEKQFAKPGEVQAGRGSSSSAIDNPNRPYPFSANGAWPVYPVSDKEKAEAAESGRIRAAEHDADRDIQRALDAQRLHTLDGLFGSSKIPAASPRPHSNWPDHLPGDPPASPKEDALARKVVQGWTDFLNHVDHPAQNQEPGYNGNSPAAPTQDTLRQTVKGWNDFLDHVNDGPSPAAPRQGSQKEHANE